MASFIIFLITLLQLALVGISYFKEWQEFFSLLFVHMSPVMVFFGGIEALTKFTGEFSFFFFPALGYCIMKYILLAISLRGQSPGFLNMGALFLEIIYVAGSSVYVVYYSYLQ